MPTSTLPRPWSVSTGSPDVVVAVIDTGVDTAHPDLAPNIWVNAGEDCPGCRTNGVDDDGNGYVDDWRGWDFANGDNDPTDDNGHGTHVAGAVAATGNNGLGVAGVTWSSRIMPLKFLGADGSGTTADAISAILYARAKGVPILNNSWGGGDVSEALRDAIEQTDASGELFVAAAGNDFTNTDVEPFYPASYDVPNVLVVGASDQLDRKAWFSNYGVRTVDLSAPGTNIYSTWPGATYRFADGTSMATPQVSGAAALARAVFPNASGVGLKALLLRDVDPIGVLNTASRTGGRLNVDRAARCAGSSASVDRLARQRHRGERRSAARDSRPRRVVRLAGRSFGQRDSERQPVRARRARRRALHGNPCRTGRSAQHHGHSDSRGVDGRPERDGDGEPDVPDRPRRQPGHDHDAFGRARTRGSSSTARPTSGSRCA